MARKNKGATREEVLINSAIDDGIKTLMKNHPLFGDNEFYIRRHINEQALKGKIRGIYEEIHEGKNKRNEE